MEGDSELSFRDYRSGDVKRMYQLDMECFDPVFRFSRRAMQRFAEARGARTVLAESAGELVGFAIAEVADGTSYIVTVDVALAWRRRGLGRRILEELERKAKLAGAEMMMLHVFKENLAAARLYESMAYENMGVAHGFYGHGLDGVMYQKRLGDPMKD